MLLAEYDYDTDIAVQRKEAFDDGIAIGEERGRNEGISIGLSQGAHQAKLETAKTFRLLTVSFHFIINKMRMNHRKEASFSLGSYRGYSLFIAKKRIPSNFYQL